MRDPKMKLAINLKTCIATIALNCFTLPTFAFSQSNLSPYADLTLNVHWDTQYNDLEPLDLTVTAASSGVKSFHLAFVTDAGTCQPAWGAQSAYATQAHWGAHLTDKLRTDGINYIISFGGASNNDLSKACSEENLIAAYENIITTYQPAGLDFDIENGTADVLKVMQALQKVQQRHPNLKLSFTLPVMPEGLTSSGQDIVSQAKAANLNFAVNIMAMDYGPAYVNDMGEYAKQAATNLYLFLKSIYPSKADADLWKMVEVTPMLGVNDVATEQFTLTNTDTLRHFANANNIGGLSFWDMSRDFPCADQWANTHCSGNNLQTQPYEFSKRFLQ
jgi:chitinase